MSNTTRWAAAVFTLVTIVLSRPSTETALARGSTQAGGDAQARAAELLARGRAAIGPVDTLKSFSAVGTQKNATSSSPSAAEPYEVHLELPDRYVQFSTFTTPSSDTRQRAYGFAGNVVLTGLRSSSGILGGGSNSDGAAERRAFANQLLGMFLVAPPSLDAKYTYVGEAETKDGQRSYIIDVSGNQGFATRLFLDPTTCRPLMLTYHVGAGAIGTAAPQGEAKKETESTTMSVGPARPGDVSVYYSDVRSAGAFTLPHTVIAMRDGKTTHETRFKTLTVNPSLKPQTFGKLP